MKEVGPNHVVVSFMLSFSTFKSVYFQFLRSNFEVGKFVILSMPNKILWNDYA